MVRRLAEEYDLPFLGQIPLVQSIREGGDQGVPIMMSDDEITKKAFEEFAAHCCKKYCNAKCANAKNNATRICQSIIIFPS